MLLSTAVIVNIFRGVFLMITITQNKQFFSLSVWTHFVQGTTQGSPCPSRYELIEAGLIRGLIHPIKAPVGSTLYCIHPGPAAEPWSFSLLSCWAQCSLRDSSGKPKSRHWSKRPFLFLFRVRCWGEHVYLFWLPVVMVIHVCLCVFMCAF